MYKVHMLLVLIGFLMSLLGALSAVLVYVHVITAVVCLWVYGVVVLYLLLLGLKLLVR